MDLAGLQIEPEDTSTSQTFPGEWWCYSRPFLSPVIGSFLHVCLWHLSSLSSFAWFFIGRFALPGCLQALQREVVRHTEVQTEHSAAFLSPAAAGSLEAS